MDNNLRIARTIGLFALMLSGSLAVQSYLAPAPSRSLASVDPSVKPAAVVTTAAKSTDVKASKSTELAPPNVAWIQWNQFNQIAERLNGAGMTDAERLKIMKMMSAALTRNLKSLTPEQVRRSLATISDDNVRLEALENLAGATKYNSSDIPVMTQPFNTLKDDAHVLLVGMGGLGGYGKPN